MPKVTIFMSSYNHALYLRESIDSVLNQTFTDYELFIVDDASTDDSWSIIQEYADPRIRAMRNEVNRNDKAVMRHVIAELACGEYFAVHHSDNLWEPGKLQAQVEYLDTHPEIGAVFTKPHNIDENGNLITEIGKPDHPLFDRPNRTRQEWLNHFFYHGNAFYHPSILIRRECYDVCGSYRDGFAQIPDLDMWVRLCLKYPIHVLPEKLIRYRVPAPDKYISGNTPETRVRKMFEKLKMLENYLRITEWQELLAVFPNAAKYENPKGFDCAYVLARLALDAPDRVTTRLFGLNILFDILGDNERSRRVFDLYGFTHKEFIALSAANDIFSSERMVHLESKLKSPKHNFSSLIRKILSWLAPPHSRREKAVQKLKSVMVFPYFIVRERRLSPQLTLIRNSGFFDENWYLAQYPDVALSGIDPALHYLLHGGLEGRDPGADFSGLSYIADHPEIVEKRINPLVHYSQSMDHSRGH